MKLDNILIGIDFSAPSFQAAHWIARHVAPGADLVLAHVITIPEAPPLVRGRFPRRDLLLATVREGRTSAFGIWAGRSQRSGSAAAAPGHAARHSAQDAMRNWLDVSLTSGADSGTEVAAEVVFGDPAPEIIRYAERWDSDLIVMGRGAGGLRRAVLGSVADAVLRHAPCPVLVLPESKSR